MFKEVDCIESCYNYVNKKKKPSIAEALNINTVGRVRTSTGS